MTGVRLARLFWFGAAAILIVAALIAVTAVLRGDFGETDAKILGTLLSLLVTSGTAVAGVALVERRVNPALGWSAVVGAVLSFLLQAAAIWDEFSSDALGKWAGTSIAVVLALLLVATQRLLVREARFLTLFRGTTAMAALAATITTVGIWTEEGGFWQAVAVTTVLTVLGYLLLPVVQRLSGVGPPAAAAPIRVLGALDGVELVAAHGHVDGVAVGTPSPGERLVLRRSG